MKTGNSFIFFKMFDKNMRLFRRSAQTAATISDDALEGAVGTLSNARAMDTYEAAARRGSSGNPLRLASRGRQGTGEIITETTTSTGTRLAQATGLAFVGATAFTMFANSGDQKRCIDTCLETGDVDGDEDSDEDGPTCEDDDRDECCKKQCKKAHPTNFLDAAAERLADVADILGIPDEILTDFGFYLQIIGAVVALFIAYRLARLAGVFKGSGKKRKIELSL